MDLHICPQCQISHVTDAYFCSAKCETQHKQGREELKRAFALYELYKEYVKFAHANLHRSIWLDLYYNDTACVKEEVYACGNHWIENLIEDNSFEEVKAALEKLNAA
jgi:hypothetical protein